MCTHPFLRGWWCGGDGGVNLQSNLQKGRGLTGPQLLEGAAWKDGVSFFREVGGNFHMKNKIKSEVFDNKNG